MLTKNIKRKTNTLLRTICCCSLLSVNMLKGFSQAKMTKDYVDYVNPYMGNISHLLVPTYPTVHLPNSLLRVYPERGDYTSDRLFGLPLIVTSHRGKSAFNLSPMVKLPGSLKPVQLYSYDQEEIHPYAYSVLLDQENIQVDYALSHQSGMYTFTFQTTSTKYLQFNSQEGKLQWDGQGLSGTQDIGNGTHVYIYAIPESKPVAVKRLQGQQLENATEAVGKNSCMVLEFNQAGTSLRMKYGVSFIDVAQAKANLKREISDFDQKKLAEKGRKIWNDALGKIAVEGDNESNKHVFYTSLYRTYERPVNISEDGRYYSAFDGKVHQDEGKPFFTDDWIWDSYRAHHPLRVLLEPGTESLILNSFVRMSEQMEQPWLPTFPEITGDSRRMNSNHGVATLLDAYRKGVRNFDIKKAYLAAKGAITEKTLAPWSGKAAGKLDEFFKEKGYIPALYPGEKETIPEVNGFERRQPVAVTLGTSYDLWCLAQLAQELGNQADYDLFMKQSFNYRNLFNEQTKFFHPKDDKGNFIMPFDYVFSGGQGAREYYGENNAWIYRWDVQHNIPDLIKLMGGNELFVKYLDEMFQQPLGRSKFDFYSQLPDHTGNVGQFSMANEPALHIPYLYNYAGQPWMTQKRIHKLIGEWFRNDLMGVPGDEDGGGMSAFVVFSQMGFYPVTPGLTSYSIGSPFFQKVSMQLPNGKSFVIIGKNASAKNKYIQSAKLNGQPLNVPQLTHADVLKGGTLEFVMGNRANRNWGN
ncbi:GH92 family glycosyl hydrolase [Sphingobacterium multivorum]|uniref:Alpha-1,2-mannosidase n=1 Tax=Sphingobacterium multivorum TaxID=28454 RepID=A0A654CTB1_SPHMU|nr:GH92 family glycosyl hydrolase [Sphingobacterium multivorum]QQT44702.1 GH92 family glycosyl hydrolase [Sphingobacterium multivorum]SUJ15127.1 Putative alpha-1,2-mannosidase [Sphingobacterium multivorum]VXC96163.1 Alpha-1,2-mannosidase [Sphingobacterium multivorum]HBI89080.1 alpha-mannosidase [Sphingobacterium sp.]